MKKGPPPPGFMKPIPADVIALAIVLASRAVDADPLDVASGKFDVVAGMAMKPRVIARARFYAGHALRRAYPDRNQTLIACYVGVKRTTAGAFFSGIDQRIAAPAGLSWYCPGVVQQIVDQIGGVLKEPEKPEPPPLKMGPLPPPKGQVEKNPIGKLEMGGFRPSPGTYELELDSARADLDRFAPNRPGALQQLDRRATERRECRDLLAEAAANTARLQAKLPKED